MGCDVACHWETLGVVGMQRARTTGALASGFEVMRGQACGDVVIVNRPWTPRLGPGGVAHMGASS